MPVSADGTPAERADAHAGTVWARTYEEAHMTAFVLVAGPWTGDWIWRVVAGRLREAGCAAYPATLTGMGDRRDEAGPDTDLETHIGDLVRLIDEVDDERVVIVGHGMGIHPVRGAADRRPDRISRIVHLDAGMPRDGESVLGLLPDPETRARLLQRAEDGWRVPAPTREEWPAWGSLAGVPDEALDELVRRGVPQPLGTLSQRLRLSGAVAALPTTGVLCTANGASIAVVETLLGLGDPQILALVDPQVTFFELATGHWPMLSVPDELAATLLKAAAGEGHRLTAPPAAEQPAAAKGFLLDVPPRPRERVGRVDLYLPDEPSGTDPGPRPAVVFVHGGPVPADRRPTPRDSDTFVGYGSYVAGLGVVGVTLDHRLHGIGDYGRAAEDVAAAVELVRADPRVDADRVALWFFSAGGLLSADWLVAPPPWLRCLAATYPVLAPLPAWGFGETRHRPVAAVRKAGRLPIVLSRVELEHAEFAVTVGEFLGAAEDCGADVEVIDVPLGHHGFETVDHTEGTRHAVERAVSSVLGHLTR